MEQFDFSEFIAPEVQNKRRENALPPKTQEYDNLKYRRAETKKGGKTTPVIQGGFHISKKLAETLGISTNALRHFVHPKDKNVVLIATVSDEHGKFMKKREGKEKGDAFKSDSLEAALANAGLIDLNAVGENQFLDLQKIADGATVAGVPTLTTYRVVKGAKKAAETASAPGTGAATTVAAPGPEATAFVPAGNKASAASAPSAEVVTEPATVQAPETKAAEAVADPGADWS